MKRLFILFITIVFCLNVIGHDNVTKLAQKYEVNNPAMFWRKLRTEHPEVNAMQKAIDQNKPAMKIVAEALGDMSSVRSQARNHSCKDPEYIDLINLMYKLTGIRDASSKVEFFIVNNTEMNAGMLPEGTCIINTGLIEKASNTEEIVAVLAHEIAHFILWHTINDCWRTAKAIRRNQTWAEIGTGLAMGTYAASQIHSAQYGVQQSSQAQQQMYNNIANAGLRIREEIGLRTDIFTRLRYMRETELEADETAFWFLEKNSIDPIHLINFLKKLDAQTPAYLKQQKNNTKFSDHPDMPKRIEKLQLMYKKYHKPISNQKSLPALSTYMPTLSSNKENSDDKNLYFDKKGWGHYDRTCYQLEQHELENTVKITSLTEEPSYCNCVPYDLRREISLNISSLSSVAILSSNKEESSSKKSDADSDVLYFDKKKIAHQNSSCQSLKNNKLDRTSSIYLLTKEPDYCPCVSEDIRWQINYNLSIPMGY